MSLEKWVEYGWLRREATSAAEIRDLLGIVDRGLADAAVEVISADLRFIAAFGAALTAATVALRAAGYRVATQTGHHVRTIETLEYTLAAKPNVIQRLKVFNNKRNKSSYDVSGVVSEQELTMLIEVAGELREEVKQWLQASHPELI